MRSLDEEYQTAAKVFAERFPSDIYTDLDFFSATWDFNNEAGKPKRPRTIYFGSADGRPFPMAFQMAVKASLVEKEFGTSSMASRVRGVRYLLVVMEEARGEYEQLSPIDILETDVEAVAAHLRGLGRAPSTIHTYTYALAQFISWGKRNGVVGPGINAEGISVSDMIEGGAGQKSRIPPTDTIRVLGKLYREVDGAADRLRIAASALLLIGGFRVGEVVALKVDCLKFEENAEGVRRWYIEYRNEKARRGDRREIRRRWLSPLAVELAREVIDEILEITKPWRPQAEVMDRFEDRVPLPKELQDLEYLHRSDFGPLFGWDPGRSGGCVVARHLGDLPQHRNTDRRYREDLRPNALFYHVRDLEEYLGSLRKTKYTLELHDGEKIRIADTLLILPQNLNQPNHRGRLGIIEPMQTHVLQNFLGPTGVFRRYGFFDADGRPIKVNTHGFRHWLNTVANKAGMTFLQLTIWMGRTEEVHTMRYIADPIEIAEIVREEADDDRMRGARLDRIRRLGEVERAEELDASIERVHCASGVYCLLDFCLHDCPKEKNCLDDCDYAVFDPDNPVQVKQLREKREQLVAALPVLQSRPGAVGKAQAASVQRQIANADDWLNDVREGGANG